MENREDTRSLDFLLKAFIRACNLECTREESPDNEYTEVVEELSSEQTEVYLAGSRFEGLSLPDTSHFTAELRAINRHHPKLKLSDTEFVFLDRTKLVCIPEAEGAGEGFAQTDSTNTHSGYVKLLKVGNNQNEQDERYYSGDLFKKESAQQQYVDKLYAALQGKSNVKARLNELESEVSVAREGASVHGPALTVEVPMHDGAYTQEMDIVVALPCSSWPPEAAGWISRPRKYAWPSHQQIQAIVDEGCYLVPVPHPHSSQPHLERRLSFSKAEKQLALSLTDPQRLCYLLMKIIYYHELKPLQTSLTSYHLKTCLFWACEETNPTMWSEDAMGVCLVSVLSSLSKYLSLKNLPNFFIPENNMVDHFDGKHMKVLLSKVNEVIAKPWKFLLPLQEVYNNNLDKNYDIVQSVLNGLHLQPFVTRNHYMNQPGLLNQALQSVLEDAEHGLYLPENNILASIKLACTLVFTKIINHIGIGNETSTLKVFLDVLDQMEEMRLAPNGWDAEHDAAFIAHIIHKMVNNVPMDQQAFTSFCAWKFLDYLLTRTNIIETERDSSFLVILVQLACKDLSLTPQQERNHVHEAILRYLDLLEATLPSQAKFLRAVFYLKQGDEKLSHLLLTEIVNGEENHVQLVLHSTQDTNHEGCYTSERLFTMLKDEANFVMAKISKAKTTLQMYTDSWTWDSRIVGECESQHGQLQLPLKFVANYLLSMIPSNDPDISRKTALTQMATASRDPSQLYLATHALVMAQQWIEALDLCTQILEISQLNIGVRVVQIMCEAQLHKGTIDSSKRDNTPHVSDENLVSQSKPKTNEMTSSNAKSIKTEKGPVLSDYTIPYNIKIMMDVMLSFRQEYIVILGNYLMHGNLCCKQSLQATLHLCLARCLHIQSHKAGTDFSNLRDFIETHFKQAVLKSGKNPICYIYYFNFLLKESRRDQLLGALEAMMNRGIYKNIKQEMKIEFYSTETDIVPDCLKPYTCKVKEIAVSCELYLLYLEASINSLSRLFYPHNDLMDRTVKVHHNLTTSTVTLTSWPKKLCISAVNDICAHITLQLGQFLDAREYFIQAVKVFPGSHRQDFIHIRQCEDKLMAGSILLMMSEEYESSLEMYANIWKTSLPRCQENCSMLLHLSQELLDLSQEDEKALKICEAMLKKAIVKHRDTTSQAHMIHVMVTLGCLNYWMGANAVEKIEHDHRLMTCENSLKEATLVTKLGSVYTLIGNFLLMEHRYEEALEYIDQAITEGTAMLPVHNAKAKMAPHNLLAVTRRYRMEHFLPVEPLFQLLVCSHEDHYDSYLVYAYYLATIALRHLGLNVKECIVEYTQLCDTIGFCPGKYALLGLVNLQNGEYTKAQHYLDLEIKDDKNDYFRKNELYHQLHVLAHCCEKIQEVDSDAARETVMDWLHNLATSKSTLVTVNKHNYETYHIVDDHSLALFMTSQLPNVLSIDNPAHIQVMSSTYRLLQDSLKDKDPMVDGLSTNIAILLCEKHAMMEEGPDKDSLALQITQAFDKAFASTDICPSTARLAYAGFLLSLRKFREAAEQSEVAASIAKEHINELLKAKIEDHDNFNDELQHMLSFYIQKSLIPASDHLVICHSIHLEFHKVFEVVDLLLAILHRAQDLEVDPLAYLIKYTLELPRFGTNISTVIAFHEAIIEKYPNSSFIPTIYNNLGCMLFSHARKQGDKTLLDKAKENFEHALSFEGISMALYADYANFLFNTGQYDAALKIICDSDDLCDSAQGSNAYGHEEAVCVDNTVRYLIESSECGKFLTDSHFYIQYLRVATLLAQDKEQNFIENEIKVLDDMGSERNIHCSQYLCESLRKTLLQRDKVIY